ncbi:MAG: hypothetical protein GY704_08670 [Phycisphaeraceae bacterium]|nr:hypothetical protein [Phycisphaeraceae bacterium]
MTDMNKIACFKTVHRHASTLAAGLVACLGTAATAGTVTTMSFTADMYRVDASGNTVSSGAGTYGVFDVFASFSDGGIRALNLYDMSISLSTGDFIHNDADTSGGGNGYWNAAYDAAGAIVGADSFVTLGTASTPNAATLDPNFSDLGSSTDAGSISADAGWYAGGGETWGDVDVNNKVFLGRFVIADGGSASGVVLTFGGSLAYNLQQPGAPIFVNDTQTFTMPTAGSSAVPGLGGVAALAGVGLVGRRRRR